MVSNNHTRGLRVFFKTCENKTKRKEKKNPEIPRVKKMNTPRVHVDGGRQGTASALPKDTFILSSREENLPWGLMLRLLSFNGLLIVQRMQEGKLERKSRG